MRAVATCLIVALTLGCAGAARVQSDMQILAPADNRHKKLCSDLDSQDDCLDGFKDAACAWCEGDTMQTCLDAEAAYSISPKVASCKGALPPKRPRCSQLLGKGDCLHVKDEACAWCEGDTMSSCVDAVAAYGISRKVARCEGALPPRKPICSDLLTRGDCLDAAKLAAAGKDADEDAAGASSGDDANKKKHRKKKLECAWCAGDVMNSCVDASAASFVPDAAAKCEGASLPGDDTKCDDLKEESICLRGTVGGACAWCSGGYMPTKCVDEEAAKFIPEFVTSCKVAKKDDKKDGV